jgi:hypothetical protein
MICNEFVNLIFIYYRCLEEVPMRGGHVWGGVLLWQKIGTSKERVGVARNERGAQAEIARKWRQQTGSD